MWDISRLMLLVLYFIPKYYKVINKYCAEMHLIEIVGMFIVEPSHGVWQHDPDLSFRIHMTRLRHDPTGKVIDDRFVVFYTYVSIYSRI